jgi:hypothetical protein
MMVGGGGVETRAPLARQQRKLEPVLMTERKRERSLAETTSEGREQGFVVDRRRR